MTENPDYRLYIERCFETIDEKLDTIYTQTLKTNDRVTHLETESNNRKVIIEDFRHLEKDFDCVKKKVDDIDKNLLEVWFFKKYPKVFIGILTAAVLATLGISYFNKKDMSEIRTKVNWIEAYERIPNAPTRGGDIPTYDTLQ